MVGAGLLYATLLLRKWYFSQENKGWHSNMLFCCGNTHYCNQKDHLGLETTNPSTSTKSIALAPRINHPLVIRYLSTGHTAVRWAPRYWYWSWPGSAICVWWPWCTHCCFNDVTQGELGIARMLWSRLAIFFHLRRMQMFWLWLISLANKTVRV